jgi:replication factor A1
MQIEELPALQQQSLKDLQMLDPFLYSSSTWQCTIVITRVQERTNWWFPSYSKCGKSCAQQSSSYSCEKCGCIKTTFRYKLTFFAADETAEAEFFCFDKIARRIVGKPCDALLRSMDISGNTHPDLAAIIGLKFTFAVTININSFYSTGKIINVDSILEAHGRQHPTSDVQRIKQEQNPLTSDEFSAPPVTEDSP